MVGLSLSGSTDRAVKMLRKMVDPKIVKVDKKIPLTLLKHCEGIAFVTIIKAGLFMLGGNIGGGCVIAKVPDPNDPKGWRWSGPSAVVCGGLGGGFIFGGEKIDSVIILNTKSAVRAFMGSKQVTFGGNLSVAAGPVGRDIEGHVGLSDTKEIVAAYSYSHAQGAIIAATLEGAFLSSSQSENNKFYGVNDAIAENVLSGKYPLPMKAQELVQELDDIFNRRKNYAGLSASSVAVDTSIAADGKKLLNAGLSGDNELPPGWKQAASATGEVYYYNVETNQTQWERPGFSSFAPPAPTMPARQPQSIPVSNPSPVRAPVAAYTVARPISSTSIPSPRPAPPIPKKSPSIRLAYATALYDYTAQQPDELSFKQNDKIAIVDKGSGGWWQGELQGRKGLVPSNYVQLG